MRLNTNIVFIFLMFTILEGFAQKEEIKKNKTYKPVQVYYDFSVGYPTYYGKNFVSKGYDLSSSRDIGLTIENILYGFNVRIDASFYSGEVVRPEVAGFFESTNFTRFSIGVGYSIVLTEKLNIVSSFHYGDIKLGHTILNENLGFFDTKVKDDGSFIGLELMAGYSILPWLDIAVGAKNYYDFLKIESGGQKDSFFRNPKAIAPFINLRLTHNTIKIKRKKSKKPN